MKLTRPTNRYNNNHHWSFSLDIKTISQQVNTSESLKTEIIDSQRERIWLLPITSAVIISVFLFYTDEGYNDFRWAGDIRNWVIFSLFVLGFFLGQAIIATYCFPKMSGWAKKGLVLGLGLPLGVLFIIFLMYISTLGYALIESLSYS